MSRFGSGQPTGSGSGATSLLMWGRGKEGQLGLGDTSSQPSPQPVPGDLIMPKDERVIGVACSVYNTVACTASGKVFTWGGGASGKLGHGGEGNEVAPRVVEALAGVKVTSVSAGDYHCAALTDAGEVYTWGWGEYGQLGHGGTASELVPRRVDALGAVVVKSVSLGGHHSACVTDDGSVFTWGWGTDGQLGHGERRNEPLPRRVESLPGPVSVVRCGVYHTGCLLRDTGAVLTWGWGKDGRLGHGAVDNQAVPRVVEALRGKKVVALSLGSYHTACVTGDGATYTWGWGEDGRLGHGDEDNQFTPRRVAALEGARAVAVACGGHHTAVLTDAGEVFTCGWGEDGKLGHGDSTTRLVPAPVRALAGREILSLACGYCHAAAIIRGRADPAQFAASAARDAGASSSDVTRSPELIREGADPIDRHIAARSPTPSGRFASTGSAGNNTSVGTPYRSSPLVQRPTSAGARASPRGSISERNGLSSPTGGSGGGGGAGVALPAPLDPATLASLSTDELCARVTELDTALRTVAGEKQRVEQLADEEIDALDAELRSLEAQLAEVGARSEELGARAARAQEETNRAKSEAAREKEARERAEARAAEAEAAAEKRLAEMAKGEGEALTAARKEIDRLERGKSEAERAADKAREEAESLRDEIDRVRQAGDKTAESLRSEIERLVAEQNAAGSDAASIAAEARAECETLRRQVAKLEADLAGAARAEERARSDVDEVRAMLADARAERDAAREDAETLASRCDELTGQLADARRDAAAELERARESFERREADLRSDLEDVVSQLERARSEIGNTNNSIATGSAANNSNSNANNANNNATSDSSSAVSSAAASVAARIADLESRIEDLVAEASRESTRADARAADAEALARHVRDLTAERDALESRLRLEQQRQPSSSSAAASPNAVNRSAAADGTEDLRRRLAEAEAGVAAAEAREAQVKADRARLEDKVHELQQQQQQQRGKASPSPGAGPTNAEVERLRADLTLARDKVAAQERLIASLEASAETNASESAMMRGEVSQLEGVVRGLEQENDRLRGQIETERARAAEREESDAGGAGRIAAEAGLLRQQLEESRADNSRLVAEIGELTQRWHQDLDRVHDLERAVNQAQQQLLQQQQQQQQVGGGGSSGSRPGSRAGSRSGSRPGTPSASMTGSQVPSRDDIASLDPETLRDSLYRANVVMDQLQGHLSRLRDELAVQRSENESVRGQLERERELLASRTAELMVGALLNDVADERDTRTLLGKAGAGGSTGAGDESAADAARELARKMRAIEQRNASLARELSETQHRLEFATTARDLVKRELDDARDALVRAKEQSGGGGSGGTGTGTGTGTTSSGGGTGVPLHVDEVAYLKQKLHQTEERMEMERARLDAERRELDDLRRVTQHKQTGEAWEQLMAARAELHTARDDLAARRADAAALAEELATTREQLAASRANCDRLREGLSDLERDVDELHGARRGDLERHRTERSRLESEAHAARESLHSAAAERDALRSEVAHLSALLQQSMEASGKEGAAVSRVVREFEECRAENTRLAEEARAARAERDESVARAAEVRSRADVEADQLRHERDSADRNRDAALADLAEMRASNDSLGRQLATLRGDLDETRKHASDTAAECERLKTTIGQLRDQARVDRESTVSLQRFKELQELLTQSKAECAGVAEELRSQRAQFAAFRQQAVARDQALRAEVEAERTKYRETYRSDREALEEDRREVLAARDALAARLDAALDKCARDRREDAAELARSQAALERARELGESEKRQMADAFAAEREALKRAIADLEDRVADRDRSLATAREAHAASQRFLEEIAQLQRDNETLANEAQRAERTCASLRQQLQHSAEQVYTHSEAALLKAQEDARASAQEAMLQTEIAKRREVQRLRLDLERAVVTARDEKHAAIEQARVQFEERLQTAEAERRRALARAQQDLDDLRRENYGLREELHALRMERDETERLFRDTDAGTPYSLIDQNAKLRNECEDLRRRLARLEESNAKLSADRDDALAEARAEARKAERNATELETQLTLATLRHGRDALGDPEKLERVHKAREAMSKARRGALEADALETENLRLRAEIDRLSSGVADTRAAHSSAAREQLAIARDENEKLRAKMGRIREEYEFARAEVQELRGRLEAREAQSRAASATSASSRRSGGSNTNVSEIDDLRREKSNLTAELVALRRDHAESRHRAQHAEREAESLAIQSRQCEEELASARRELRETSEQLAATDAECKRMKRVLIENGHDPRGPINRDTDADLLDRRELVKDRERLEALVTDLKARLEVAELKARSGNASGSAGMDRPVVGTVSGRGSSAEEMKVERDMDRMRAMTAPERARAKENLRGGRPLFDDDGDHAREVTAEMREFEAMEEKLHVLWRLRVELQNSTIERLNPKQSRRDGVKELLETSNSRIDGILGQIRRLRRETRYQEGDLFDHVSELLIENGEAYKKVNSYSEALLGATLSKLARLKREQGTDDGSGASPAGGGARTRSAPGQQQQQQQRQQQQQQQQQQPKEEPGFFASLFGLADEEENKEPQPAPRQEAPRGTNSRARSRFA